MSNTPLQPDEAPLHDTEAEELAAKHGISVDKARRHLEEQGHDRAAADGAAEAEKLGSAD